MLFGVTWGVAPYPIRFLKKAEQKLLCRLRRALVLVWRFHSQKALAFWFEKFSPSLFQKAGGVVGQSPTVLISFRRKIQNEVYGSKRDKREIPCIFREQGAFKNGKLITHSTE
jgi:hypothetical protein